MNRNRCERMTPPEENWGWVLAAKAKHLSTLYSKHVKLVAHGIHVSFIWPILTCEFDMLARVAMLTTTTGNILNLPQQPGLLSTNVKKLSDGYIFGKVFSIKILLKKKKNN